MAVFDADLAAIRFAEDIEDTAQRRGLFAVQAAGDEFAVEVPDRQAEVFEIELRRMLRGHIERVDVRQQVAADAVRVDQLQYVRLFFGLLGEAVAAEQRRVVILRPTERRIIDLEVVKDLVVKFVLADKKFVDPSRGTARFRHPGSRGGRRCWSA